MINDGNQYDVSNIKHKLYWPKIKDVKQHQNHITGLSIHMTAIYELLLLNKMKCNNNNAADLHAMQLN